MPDDPVSRVLAAYPVLHHALRQRQVVRGTVMVSAHQATILAHLDRAEGCTLSELAAAMGVALPTMSLLVARLVRAGLINRERDSSDGRRVTLTVSELGERIARKQSVLDPERVRRLLEALSPEERRLGVQGLTALARGAARLPALPRFNSSERGRS